MGKWENRYYVDFRIDVDKAEDIKDAVDKAESLLRETGSSRIIKAVTLQKNPNKKYPFQWELSAVRWGDPRSEFKETR